MCKDFSDNSLMFFQDTLEKDQEEKIEVTRQKRKVIWKEADYYWFVSLKSKFNEEAGESGCKKEDK